MNVNNRPILALLVSCLCILVGGCTDADDESSGESRPNILLIVADDLGYADLGVMGSEIATPNIDALARSGILFSQFHSANMCAPARAMLLSGNNNHVAGMARQDSRGLGGNPVTGPGIPMRGYEAALSDRIVPFPKVLRDSGYHTSIVGKWHLGFELENSPLAAGFSRSWVLLDGSGDHFSDLGVVEGGSTYRADDQLVEWPRDAYSTEFFTDTLIEFIGEGLEQDQPFFAFASYTAPHWPLQVPDEYLDLYAGEYDAGYDALRERRFSQLIEAGIIPADSTFPDRNSDITPWEDLSAEQQRVESRRMELYAAMVDNLDDHVGRLLDYLRERDALENTLIIFMGDNGAAGRGHACITVRATYRICV